MKNIAILGSTGSIGSQTMEVIDEFQENYAVTILSAHSNYEIILDQINKYEPEYVFITEKKCFEKLQHLRHHKTKICFGFTELSKSDERNK